MQTTVHHPKECVQKDTQWNRANGTIHVEEVLARDIHLIRLPLLPYQCRQRLSESIIPHLLAFLELLFLSLLNQILFCQVTIAHRGIAMKNLDFFQYQVRRELAADILAGSAPLSIKYFSIWRVALFMRDSKTSFYPGKKIGAEARQRLVKENSGTTQIPILTYAKCLVKDDFCQGANIGPSA